MRGIARGCFGFVTIVLILAFFETKPPLLWVVPQAILAHHNAPLDRGYPRRQKVKHPLKLILDKLFRLKLARNDAGGVLAYGAVFAALAAGATAFSVDYGRISVLRTQVQNRADAGAMAGAAQLDGKDGARARAQNIAMNAISERTGISAGSSDMSIFTPTFYASYGAVPIAAVGDDDAKFIEVKVTPKQVNFMFAPILRAISGSANSNSALVGARAVAGPNPFICHAPPMMLCNPAEEDPALDLDLAANFGRQIVLKEPESGGGPWTPGNFGLLSLPDGSSGAADIEAALAATTPDDCYTLDVTTAPGSKTNKVKNGINARFDMPGGLIPPAPNVINYPRDDDVITETAGRLGSGIWDIATYWAAKHEGAAVPVVLLGASRYQTYLYEQGLSYAHQGKETIYPVPDPLPAGFETVVPPPADIPVAVDPANSDDPNFDGVPVNVVATNGEARRLLKVAILNCISDGVNGKGTYPTTGNYVDIFVTEMVQDPPNAAIYGEIVRPVTTISSPDFHANVRLVR